ncbi:hypothetical protein MC885_013396, partial [Smutsia gigantea]
SERGGGRAGGAGPRGVERPRGPPRRPVTTPGRQRLTWSLRRPQLHSWDPPPPSRPGQVPGERGLPREGGCAYSAAGRREPQPGPQRLGAASSRLSSFCPRPPRSEKLGRYTRIQKALARVTLVQEKQLSYRTSLSAEAGSVAGCCSCRDSAPSRTPVQGEKQRCHVFKVSRSIQLHPGSWSRRQTELMFYTFGLNHLPTLSFRVEMDRAGRRLWRSLGNIIKVGTDNRLPCGEDSRAGRVLKARGICPFVWGEVIGHSHERGEGIGRCSGVPRHVVQILQCMQRVGLGPSYGSPPARAPVLGGAPCLQLGEATGARRQGLQGISGHRVQLAETIGHCLLPRVPLRRMERSLGLVI